MLDSNVARLYNYQTKRVNETTGRNKKRFPENFCFQLTKCIYRTRNSNVIRFVEMRKFLIINEQVLERLINVEHKLLRHTKNLI